MRKHKVIKILQWLFYTSISALIIAILFMYYIGKPTVVKMDSMYPTLVQGEKLIVNRWLRTAKKMPNRSDLIIFEQPSKISYNSLEELDMSNPIARYENEPKNLFKKFSYYVLEINKVSYVKRVIALPGEHVQIEYGKVYINNEELKEKYLQENTRTDLSRGIGFDDFIVPENCVFAMGDNRRNSIDCRDFGCIPIDKIEGKVWLKLNNVSKSL